MWIALIVLAVLALSYFVIYNGLIGKKNQVENAFASIDTMLKKRYDLIPNLVATVKQYAGHESDTLTKITELRSKAMSGGLSSDEQVQVNNQISKAMGGIMVAVESYPELKANENFLQLQRSLNEIEEQISASRRAFNSSVTDFNNAIEMFPSNIVAGMMSYQRKQLFEIPREERENVNVGELFGN
jgi:LemA protein